MLRIIGAFLLGVVTTLAVVHWTTDDTRVAPGPKVGRAGAIEAPAPANAALPEEAGVESDDRITGSEPDGASMIAAAPAERASHNPELPASQVPENPESERVDVEPNPATPKSEYAPEIAEMIEQSVNKHLQSRYENDAREDSWATYMEGMLAAYFEQKPGLSQFYFPLIDCRTSVCSVHVLGYGVDALTQWNTATADLVSQQWFEFKSMSMNRRNPEPGILAVVLIITKDPPG